MTRQFRRRLLDCRVLILSTLAFSPIVFAEAIPAEILQNLASDKFADRETGQRELSEWAHKQPAKSIRELHKQAIQSSDPEIRTRCLAVLKQIVLEREFREEGYLGISMIEFEAAIPGATPRHAIRVGLVMAGTAAERAGLVSGTVIIGLGEKVWRKEGMAADFARIIREIRPGTPIQLSLLIDGKVVRKQVVLGAKPDDLGAGDGRGSVGKAKDRFFEQWLDKHEAAAR